MLAPRIRSSELNFQRNFQHGNLRNGQASIIFSDESMFRINHNGGAQRVRRRPEESSKFYHLGTQNDREGCMVWGCISANGVGPLIKFEGNVTGDVYLEVLKANLTQNYPGLVEYGLIFQNDNAPAHRFTPVGEWLDEKGIETLVWPPQSPDLNPIENVWGWLKSRLRGKRFRNSEELWEELKKLWFSTPDSYISKLYDSMSNRIKSVLILKGNPTKY